MVRDAHDLIPALTDESRRLHQGYLLARDFGCHDVADLIREAQWKLTAAIGRLAKSETASQAEAVAP
jgi:hypothetical protein